MKKVALLLLFSLAGCATQPDIVATQYQRVSTVETVELDNRNCVAVIDSESYKMESNVEHRKVVQHVITQHYQNVRVVLHGNADSAVALAEAMETSPCRVVNISSLAGYVALVAAAQQVQLLKDTQYIVAVGNRNDVAIRNIKNHSGGFWFPKNVTLVAGIRESGSISCEFISQYTPTRCITLQSHGGGIVEYRGTKYRGSSFAAPAVAGAVEANGGKLLKLPPG